MNSAVGEMTMLLRIQQSDQHRKALEELETMRDRTLPSATIPEDVPIDVEDAAS